MNITERRMTHWLRCPYDPSLSATPMPWVGMYTAAASLLCCLAMAADLLDGFRCKRTWFLCKYFSLNAATLAILSIAMKIPMDLSTSMPDPTDQLTKLSSTVLMTVSLANFFPSLGAMGDKEILTNLAALALLLIPMIVNVSIELSTEVISICTMPENITVLFSLLVLFVMLTFSALTVPTHKKHQELKYNEMSKLDSSARERSEQAGNVTAEKLKDEIKKYWMMAETGSLQAVMARSVTCSASGAISFITALLLAEATLRLYSYGYSFLHFSYEESSYKWSTRFILLTQTAAVGVGVIAPIFRWFAVLKFKSSGEVSTCYRDGCTVEKYWTEKLQTWKKSPLPLQIRGPRCRILVQGMKDLFLDFCIMVQIVIVRVSKFFCFVFVFLVVSFSLCYRYCIELKSKLICKLIPSENHPAPRSEPAGTILGLGHYALYLDGEEELPDRTIRKISSAVEHFIEMGKSKKPIFLVELLKKSKGVNGVAQFDSNCVPPLGSQEPPNCWALPLVTLTSIGIAIPHIEDLTVSRLVRGVSEGLLYVRLVEKSMDAKRDLMNIRDAADRVSLDVECHGKWLGRDLRKLAAKGRSLRETLERLAILSKNIVMEFIIRNTGGLEDPINWPVNVLAAHSMYRISKTLLLDFEGSNDQTEEVVLFGKLSVMTADILIACLTNIPRVITARCRSHAIENSGEGVREAAHLLGETEEILQILLQHKLPVLSADQAADIEEWRYMISQRSPLAPASASNHLDSDAAVKVHVSCT